MFQGLPKDALEQVADGDVQATLSVLQQSRQPDVTVTSSAARTAESDAMSKALRSLGFGFVGPTVCYAFMQAVGMVNDHLVTCFRYRL